MTATIYLRVLWKVAGQHAAYGCCTVRTAPHRPFTDSRLWVGPARWVVGPFELTHYLRVDHA
jgi:hypothetical protein